LACAILLQTYLPHNMSNLFDLILDDYVKVELKAEQAEPSILRSTFCNVLNESQVELTKEQIYKMWSILTPDQEDHIRKQFEKCNTFWY
jgi:hypothetical protein